MTTKVDISGLILYTLFLLFGGITIGGDYHDYIADYLLWFAWAGLACFGGLVYIFLSQTSDNTQTPTAKVIKDE